MNHQDFWAQLVNKAYWQVVFALIVAFATSYANNLFVRRRDEQTRLREAISNFHSYGYQLQQVVSNRLQCETYVNFYAELNRLTEDPIYVEQQKIEVNNMPNLSLSVSRAYGDLYKTISILEQHLPSTEVKKLETYFDALRNYKFFIVPELSASSMDDVIKYRDKTTKAISVWISDNIKSNTNTAYKIMLRGVPRSRLNGLKGITKAFRTKTRYGKTHGA